jgi:protease YdgD
MFCVLARGLPLVAALALSMFGAANAAAVGPSEPHREAVDEQRYPWSSIGKLFNETGASCSGVVISRDRILTAAHCLYNPRSGRFIAPKALHFLVGYRTGRFSAHARIASYEIGPGFDPRRYDQTSESDWAVLTVREPLPAEIEPLRLRRELSPTGTKAALAGYGQDRALAMTADRDCELREKVDAGRFLLHTCRSTFGYSGAPILVGTGGREVEVAGIQIASMQSDGSEKMIAVPAQAILRQGDAPHEPVPVIAMPVFVSAELCVAVAEGEPPVSLQAVQARLDWQPTECVASEQPDWQIADTMAWLWPESVAMAFP